MNKIIHQKNMRVVAKRMPAFVPMLEKKVPEICQFRFETAKNSSPTLLAQFQGNEFSIHSKYDPEKEASQQLKGMSFRNPRLMLILGLGFGYHVRAVLKDLEKENVGIVLVERDINAFRFAVENVDLTDLFESPKIRWMVGVPENEAFAILTDLLKNAGPIFQLFLKTLVVFEHPTLGKIHGDYHRHVVKSFREAAESIIVNYGTCPDDSMMGVRNIMRNLEVIIRNPGIQDLFGKFKGVPGLLVSTGPSLDKNITDLIGAEQRCVMMCADSALQVLHKNGITPHAFATLERVLETVEVYKNLPEEVMKKVWLAGTPVIRPEGYAAWKGPTFITYRDFAHFEWIDIPKGTLKIGPSCSNMAFKMLEAMGCDPIILVGQDCAFVDEKKTHAAGAHDKLMPADFNRSQMYKIKGNFQDEVWTDQYFDLFRKQFVFDVSNYKGTCINSTSGGAYIEGTQMMPLREALDRYCTKPIDTPALLHKYLKYPEPEEVNRVWGKLKPTLKETMKEVQEVIDFCESTYQQIVAFEKELSDGQYTEIEDFLARYPADRLSELHATFTQARSRILVFGKYFQLYLMHIVQMIIVRYEMDLNELPSICEDEKRCQLQAIRLMKSWFPTIRDVCRLSLKLLNEAFDELKVKFDPPVEQG